MIAEVAEPETAVVVAVLPADQLAEINVTDAALDEMLATAKTLSADDKDSYETTHKFCVMAMRTRKGIERIGDSLIEPKKAEIQEIKDEVTRLVGRVKEAEDIARPLKEGWEAKEKERKEAAQKAALAKQHERTQQLINLGMAWNGGGGYDLDHFSVEAIEIKAAPDEQWKEIIGEVAEHVEQKRLQKLEADRIAEEERQAAALLLENQRLEQEARQRELDDQQKEVTRQANEARQIILQARTERLNGLGLTKGHAGYYLNGAIVFSLNGLELMSSEEFDKHYTDLVNFITAAKEKAEKEAADEALYQTRKEQIDGADFLLEPAIYEVFRTAYTKAEIIAFTEEQFGQIFADVHSQNDEYLSEQQRLAQAKKRADQQRTARLKPERGVFIGHLDKLKKVAHPKPEQAEMMELVDRFTAAYSKLLADFREQATNL